MIVIRVDDGGVIDAFNNLIALGEDSSGPLKAIGEALLAQTKTRFDKSEDPYGTPWQQNSDTTLRSALHGSGKNFTKKGGLSKRGATLLANKKPLIGESKSLSTQFSPTVLGRDTVTVTSLMPYAAMQNFGGSKASFPHLWGDIPARPFFPDTERGLPEAYAADVSEVLRAALTAAWERK